MRRRQNEKGLALVAVMLVMVLLLGIGAALHTGTIAETSLRGAQARAVAGFYAAEAGIDRGMGTYRDIFLAYNVPTGSDFNSHTFSLGPQTVTYQLASVPGNPTQVTVPAGKPFAGLHAIEYKYTANSGSSLNAGDTGASLGTEFDVDYIPLFQFLAFYQNDLEILPGPNMTLHGPIHTNGNLYLNSNNTLTIADLEPTIPTVHVSASGFIFRGRKDQNQCIGTVNIAKLVDANHDGNLDLQALPCAGVESSATLSTWLGALRANQPIVAVPTPDVIARGSGTFWQKADLRIVLDLTTPDANLNYPIVVQDVTGSVDVAKNALLQAFMIAKPGRIFYTDVPLPGKQNATACGAADSYCTVTNYAPAFGANQIYACPQSDLGLYPGCGANVIVNQAMAAPFVGTVTARRGGFYINREHAWTYMLNVNLHDLLAWNRAQPAASQLFDPNDTSDGGVIVFLSVAGAGSNGIPNPRYGARVFGSSDLDFPPFGAGDPTGVTLATDHALFVEGDYNVGTGAHPKMPAALLGDTVNVLSKNWSGNGGTRNDYQSRQTLAARPAVSTAINAAFLAAVDTTAVGNYNGGFENYPRFHETWTGQTLTYRGSFVSLGNPQHASGAWCGTGGSSGGGCNMYNPPVRAWDYDTDFQDVRYLPPLTPRFVTVQQILFTENFR